MLAKDIMETKVITLRKEATIKEIGEMMIEHGISGFPVVDGENRVLGVVSELDLMRKEIKPNEPNLWLVCVWGVNNQKKIQEYIEENHLEDQLSTELAEEGLMIRIKERALFPSGSAQLVGQAQSIVPVVAGMLASLPERVVISGHTDNVPISTAVSV